MLIIVKQSVNLYILYFRHILACENTIYINSSLNATIIVQS